MQFTVVFHPANCVAPFTVRFKMTEDFAPRPLRSELDAAVRGVVNYRLRNAFYGETMTAELRVQVIELIKRSAVNTHLLLDIDLALSGVYRRAGKPGGLTSADKPEWLNYEAFEARVMAADFEGLTDEQLSGLVINPWLCSEALRSIANAGQSYFPAWANAVSDEEERLDDRYATDMDIIDQVIEVAVQEKLLPPSAAVNQ